MAWQFGGLWELNEYTEYSDIDFNTLAQKFGVR